jgi:hypothetical protein
MMADGANEKLARTIASICVLARYVERSAFSSNVGCLNANDEYES